MSDTAMRKSNPFNIGPGVPPPYLAGRQNEQELFNSSLESMAAGESVSMVVMYGPRGMGKTTLLGWLQKQCFERKIRHVAETSATMLGSIEALTNVLLPMSWRFWEWHVNLGSKWLGAGVSAPTQSTGKEGFLAKRLIARCRRH